MMAVDFRCEKCGKLLSLEAEPGSTVRCPHCRRKLTVPEALAALPRPHVPPNAPPAGPPVHPGPAPWEDDEITGPDSMMMVMAHLMPWVISLFFHMGLGLIMTFVAMIVVQSRIPEHVTIPDAFLTDNPGGVMNPGNRDLEMSVRQPIPTEQKHHAPREAAIPRDIGKTDKRIDLIGIGAGGMQGGALAPFGLNEGGAEAGTRSSFFGQGGNAHHIVFVIDRSGSMLDTFDYVRQEMLMSISRLRPPQDFHVILFASDKQLDKRIDAPAVLENPPKKLVPAEYEQKEKVAEFLTTVVPEGHTNPIPALRRAFAVLKQANARPGKLIYLLTDGEFPDNEAVLRAIREANPGSKVFINTYLYDFRAPTAVSVMKQIADESGGLYRYVPVNE